MRLGASIGGRCGGCENLERFWLWVQIRLWYADMCGHVLVLYFDAVVSISVFLEAYFSTFGRVVGMIAQILACPDGSSLKLHV